MKNKQRKYINRGRVDDSCNYAKLFSLIGWLTSGVQLGIFLLLLWLSALSPENFHHYVVGLALSSATNLACFFSMILGSIAKRNKKYALVCIVLSVASATMAFCSINHPYVSQFFAYVLPILISGVSNLSAVVFYANYWSKALSNWDEMLAYKNMSAEEKDSRDSKDKKKFLRATLVSMLVFGITVSAVIPAEYFKNCDIVYNEMVSDMGRAGRGFLVLDDAMSLKSYLEELPKGYRDTDRIKEQFEIYRKLVNNLYQNHSGVNARETIAKMYELKKADDRWDFSRYNSNTDLYCDATWKCGDYFLTIGKETGIETAHEFTTNFPIKEISDFDGEEIDVRILNTFRRYSSEGLGLLLSYEFWYLGYDLSYEYEGQVQNISVNVCKVDSISYVLEKEQFVLRVFCIATQKYYEMTLT